MLGNITIGGNMLGLYEDATFYALHTEADPWLIASWVLEFHSHSSYQGRQHFRREVVKTVNKVREGK